MFLRSRLLTVLGCLVLTAGLWPTTAEAQVPGIPSIRGRGGVNRPGGRDQRHATNPDQQAQQQLQKLPPLETAGTIEAVMPGYIKLESEAKQTWIIQVLPNARCQLTGKATPDALSPGLFIRFIAEVNKRGAVDEKVSKLTVFTPSQTRQVGADPDNGLGTAFGPRPGDQLGDHAKPKPAFGAGIAAPDPMLAAGAKKAGSPSGGTSQVYDIRGQIVSVNNGRIQLQVPNAYFRPSLRIEVAENADIDVELDDPMCYTLARKGDKVRIQGRQGLGNRGIAEGIDIILSEPLSAPHQDGKKSAKGPRGKPGAKADAPAESGDPKAEKKEAEAPDGEKKTDSPQDESADDAKSAKKQSKPTSADTPDKPAKKKKKTSKSADPQDS
jgi:hypothetical protein